jgi:hypothetical protein
MACHSVQALARRLWVPVLALVKPWVVLWAPYDSRCTLYWHWHRTQQREGRCLSFMACSGKGWQASWWYHTNWLLGLLWLANAPILGSRGSDSIVFVQCTCSTKCRSAVCIQSVVPAWQGGWLQAVTHADTKGVLILQSQQTSVIHSLTALSCGTSSGSLGQGQMLGQHHRASLATWKHIRSCTTASLKRKNNIADVLRAYNCLLSPSMLVSWPSNRS